MRKIFNIENEDEREELFGILPEDVVKIERDYFNNTIFTYTDGCKATSNLFQINFGNLAFITRPVDPKDLIGNLVWFKIFEGQEARIGFLLKVLDDEHKPYVCTSSISEQISHDCCWIRAVTKDEISIYEPKVEVELHEQVVEKKVNRKIPGRKGKFTLEQKMEIARSKKTIRELMIQYDCTAKTISTYRKKYR